MADKSLNKAAGTLDETIWGHRWGYKDTRFVVNPDRSVKVTGNRYAVSGYDIDLQEALRVGRRRRRLGQIPRQARHRRRRAAKRRQAVRQLLPELPQRGVDALQPPD